MRFLCAPDKLKESLDAPAVARAMERGLLRSLPGAHVDLCPIGDGGEGTASALAAATGGAAIATRVTGPLGEGVDAAWFALGPGLEGRGTTGAPSVPPKGAASGAAFGAAIEMASAAGLALVPAALRDPSRTTTLGFGELIRAARAAGAMSFVLAIGGSATNDGGAGMAQALGVRFLDARGRLINQPMTGGLLPQVARIDPAGVRELFKGCGLTAACDVDNPLTGPRGASQVYAPQKGADGPMVERLDAALHHLAELWRRDLGADVEAMPGAGAAGGLGGGLAAFLGARLRPGAAMVLDAVRFHDRLTRCAACLTAEGRLDEQTLRGKAVSGVAQAAAARGVPVVAFVGSVEGDAQELARRAGLAGVIEIGRGRSREESIRLASGLMEEAVAQWAERAFGARGVDGAPRLGA